MAETVKGVLKYKVNGQWIPIQSIQGATGAVGPTGATGIGEIGPTGAIGPTGPAGGGGDLSHSEFSHINPETVTIYELASILKGSN